MSCPAGWQPVSIPGASGPMCRGGIMGLQILSETDASAQNNRVAAYQTQGGNDFTRYGIKADFIGYDANGAPWGYVTGDPFDQTNASQHSKGDDGTYWQNADGTWSARSHGQNQQFTLPADNGTNVGWNPLGSLFQSKPKTGLPAAYTAAGQTKWASDLVAGAKAVGTVGLNSVVPGLGSLGAGVAGGAGVTPQSGVVAKGYANPPCACAGAPGCACTPSAGPSRALILVVVLAVGFILWRVLS